MVETVTTRKIGTAGEGWQAAQRQPDHRREQHMQCMQLASVKDARAAPGET
jgi:hypothetical protein